MIRFALVRLALVAPVVLLLSAAAFALGAVAPGDPARILVEASGFSPAPPEMVAAKRAELGLDQPLLARYLAWVHDIIRGDFGTSYRSGQPVLALYADRLVATLALGAAAALVALVVAVPLGVVAAFRPRSKINLVVSAIATIGIAVPGFWLSYILLYVFSVELRWFPVLSSLSMRGIVLPSVVLALPAIAIQSRIVRTSVGDVLAQDFVLTARAKGLGEWRLGVTHVLPNALTPFLTVYGLELATIFSSAAIIEYVFAWPGVGKLAIDSILVRDLPVVVGFVVLAGVIMVLTNLAADLLIAAIDPRVRNAGQRHA
jgi:peptide/nickel transport system permease protein